MTVGLLASDVFRYAMIAGTIAAAAASLVGYFVVLRAQAFAAESLLDVCFAGSTGAALLGVSPILGMSVFGLGAALGIGALGERARERSVEIGMVVSFALGLGILFLGLYAHRSASHANAGAAILFGSLLSIQPGDLVRVGVLAALAGAGLLLLFRPLLFSTIDPEGARARGVPVRLVASAFLAVTALAASVAAMAVGVLLAASLLIAPAAAAVRVTRRAGASVLLSVCLGIGITWGGIAISFLWPGRHPPVGFTVSAIAAAVYFTAAAASRTAYSGRAKTVIIGDNTETGQWISKPGSPRPSARSGNGARGRGARSPGA